ncbi:MAG: ABC transporter permease [Saprospiraceae bacterium]|nr:ABC transporter permease [Saprospiraceae bacterium]
MWRNYLRASIRSISKSPQFSILNTLGLAIGIAIASLLILYLKNEWSFNQNHSRLENIHRVIVTADLGDGKEQWANAPNAVGPSVVESISGIKNQVRLLKHNFGEIAFLQVENQTYTQDNFYWVDSSVAEVFDIEIVRGASGQILNQPNQVIISESASARVFGMEDPIGKTITVDQGSDLEITAVYADLPQNSSFDAEMMGSFATSNFSKRRSWSNSSFETYLLLYPDTDPLQIERGMMDLMEQNVEEEGRWYSLSLQPLSDVHLGSAAIESAYTSRLGDPAQLRLLFYLAIVVLLIASINYMNLSTARSEKRIKEVAINKTIGASRASIILRFYLETLLLVCLAVVVSFVILVLVLPYFNQLADKRFLVSDLFRSDFIGSISLVALVIVVLSGAYPALYLSGFTPANLFRDRAGQQAWSAVLFRKGLVVAQFCASLVIIVATLAFYKQLQFIQNKKLGFEPEQVLAISTAGAKDGNEVRALVNELQALGAVQHVSRAQTFPGADGSGRSLEKPLDASRSIILQTNRGDAELLDALSLELIAGRTLPETGATNDSTVQVILNEQAVAFLEYTPEEAIGKEAPGLFWQKTSEIIGVVRDFHFESFHKPIGAYVIHNNPSEWRNYALVKFNSSELRSTMQEMEAAFRRTVPNSAFDYVFLDDHLAQLYRSEDRTARIFMIFGGISIFIACLGLFGLSAYKAERRKREIGIRKVLGADVSAIVFLLSKEFLMLVLLALLIAIPAAWYLLDNWHQNFAYSSGITVGPFLIAGIITILVALGTTGYQSTRAAMRNPVETMRTE